ncbi:MFS transporter [Saccharothrix syringae]|uniref:MFS transporter n=1 Tax=Saccharothrix syringae TaxID=103733 RepID=A0A5Q0GWB8_SACSY|nr:MFS transporter [Saccharothrix syringae]QFZ18231.1 MFS transporter [Saccharothrix syringae]
MLGRRFAWLWTAYGVSTFGTRLAFDAFPMIAVLVLHAGPTGVSALAAAGLAVGAVVAVPLGPWVEFHRKRPVMIATDLVRCAALLSVPVAFALDLLGFAQLLVVSVVVAAADVAFTAACGALVKAIVAPRDLLVATGRFEATTWTATALGPPLGGAAVGLFGPVVTVLADAVSYLCSALAVRAIGGPEPRPARGGESGSDAPQPAAPHAAPRSAAPEGAAARAAAPQPGAPQPGAPQPGVARAAAPQPTASRTASRTAALSEGWRYVLTHPDLRPLFLNTLLVNSLIMAPAPLLAVLLLGDLGFTPWQYGLAFAAPCVGGLIGSRLARPLTARFGGHAVLRTAGALRACWSLGLAFVGPGTAGLVLVIVVELGLITCMGVFTPVFAAHRLDRLPRDRVARVLAAWSVSGKLVTAAVTALWGLLAALTSARAAIAVAGVLLLATPLLLPRREREHAR